MPVSASPAGVRRRPLSCCRFQIGILGVIALVLLRITIGWHILYEGVWKIEQDDFSAEGFLSQASGPFAEHFQYQVLKDFEGRERLSAAHNVAEMQSYYDRFIKQFQPEGQAKVTAERILATRTSNVKSYLESPDNGKLIADNFNAWDKLNAKKQAIKDGKSGAPFEDRRLWEATQSLRADVRPALSWVKAQHAGLKNDLRNVLPTEQRTSAVTYSWQEKLADPDVLVTYACIAIGVCLMIGLFTRLAAFGGAVFLGLIFLSKLEWPGYYSPPAHPAQGHSLFITKEFIEMMCCFVLAALPVGRWGGLDFIVHHIFVRPFTVKKV